jgi:hypothetical protein
VKHDRLKISKIVDELMNYCFYMGSTNIHVDVQETDEFFKIYCKCDYKDSNLKKVEKMVKLLNCTKHEELEEYYWTLTGDCDVANELSLVGMMTDEATVKYSEGQDIEITLYRYKQNKE